MTAETSNARGDLLRPKLENIISGHRINADDADWLRGLLATAQQPAAVDGSVVIDGRRYDVETVRTALLGLAADYATQHQEPTT